MAKVMFFNLKNWVIHQYWEKCLAKHMELNQDEVICVNLTSPIGGDDLKTGRMYEHIHSHISAKTGEQATKMFQVRNNVRLEDYFTTEDLQKIERVLGKATIKELKTLVYKGITVGKLVRTSCVRQAHTIDEDSPEYQSFFYDNISTALYYIDAFERLLTQHQPDTVFCMNGIFFAERILVEMCKVRKTRIVTYERAARPQHLYITANEPINTFNFDNRFDAMKDIALTEQETKDIENYLKDRRTSRNTTQKFQDTQTDDLDLTKKYIKYDELRDKKKRIVTLFTNVMWDTAAVDKDTIFCNVQDWCIKSIDYAAKNPDIEMFIRIHPADARYWGFAGAKQLQDEILKIVPQLPSNVHLIKSQEKINSYCLAELSDVCVTYTSQIGVEVAAIGRPLIIAGEAFYRNKGFGCTPITQEEYFHVLKNGVFEADKEIALRYAHFLYFKMHYPFNCIVEDATKGMGVITELKFVTDGHIDFNYIKNDEELKKIADYVREGITDEYMCPIYKVTPPQEVKQ